MKLLKLLLIIIIFIINFTKVNSVENNDDLVNKISKNIRCLVCQGQSIYDSQSDFALSMKLVIEEKVSLGLSEKEIYNYLKSQYGEWILYDPVFELKTLLLWTLPLVIFLFGGWIIFRNSKIT